MLSSPASLQYFSIPPGAGASITNRCFAPGALSIELHESSPSSTSRLPESFDLHAIHFMLAWTFKAKKSDLWPGPAFLKKSRYNQLMQGDLEFLLQIMECISELLIEAPKGRVTPAS
jgi:hypothetical protein